MSVILRSILFFALMPWRLLVNGDTRLGRAELHNKKRRTYEVTGKIFSLKRVS